MFRFLKNTIITMPIFVIYMAIVADYIAIIKLLSVTI